MVSFAVVLFFAVTGFTLNHADWFSRGARTTEIHGTMPQRLLRSAGPDGVDRLGITEKLRTGNHVHGAVSDLQADNTQVSVSFRAPGYTADAFIDRATGRYDLTVVQNGLVAVLNDLHRGGPNTGKPWSALIDTTAILLTLVSVTGLVLLWYLQKRRTAGLILATSALLAILLLWKFAVP